MAYMKISTKANKRILTIMYTNATLAVIKVDELCSVACNLKPDIILSSESWTNDDIGTVFLNIQGYELSVRKIDQIHKQVEAEEH